MKIKDLYQIVPEDMEIVNMFEGRESPFMDVYQERRTYYHGSSTEAKITDRLLPPNMTGVLSELGRKKNLDKVFFTADIGSARIYAGRAVNKLGGNPVIYEVSPVGRIETLNDTQGTTVYYADWAYVKRVVY